MGFPAAVRAHVKKEYEEAALQYQRALDQRDFREPLFQNYGALLREIGNTSKAIEVYQLGLQKYPDSLLIKKNYVNLLRETSPIKAVPLLIDILHTKYARQQVPDDSDYTSLIDCLRSLSCDDWAYHVLHHAIDILGLSAPLAIECVKFLATTGANDQYFVDNAKSIERLLVSRVASFTSLEHLEFLYALSWIKFKNSESKLALNYISEAQMIIKSTSFDSYEDHRKALKLNSLHSWNASNILLQLQDFELGWKLFDHGLRTPAKGPQKWQRAMPKPFTSSEVPIWRGEELFNKSLLLLEEQAIGDVMQFLTLVPSLLNEVSSLSVLVNKRLLPIYKRAFSKIAGQEKLSVYSFSDVANNALKAKMFDFQSPLGSICQYRFKHPRDFGKHLPILDVETSKTSLLKQKYLNAAPPSVKKIIGISWRGGGTGQRIKEKSTPFNVFFDIMKRFPEILFVSLQYGDPSPALKKWSDDGVNVYHDESINPLRDMDSWLTQVSVCDAVLSVANTTIHGSGGLNIPTLCLLSTACDWRWLTDTRVNTSYWYPSVSIARQDLDGGWRSAVERSLEWIESGISPESKCYYTL